MYNNPNSTSSKGLFTETGTDQDSSTLFQNGNMPPERLSWSATFVGYDHLDNNFLYRRLHFKNLRNSKGKLVKSRFSIDESEELQVIGPLSYGEIINFTTDINFKDIKFCYPHGKSIEGS